MKLSLTLLELEEQLNSKGYILSDKSKSLNSAALAKDVHDKLVESGVDVDKFLMLGGIVYQILTSHAGGF